jgi:PKD repeat protein
LTPGPTPSGWHSPGPACTITNNFGKQQGVFVEIDNVKRASAVFEDSSTSYDPTNGGGSYGGAIVNDFTFNIYDPAVVSNYGTSCKSASDPTCYGRIHLEIDRDWQAAKYCGSGTSCDPSTLSSQTTSGVTLIDFQGFVYWDNNNVNSAGHSFSGWELHPLTGWRIHQASLNVGISFTPTSPVTGQAVTFTGTASGGTAPYTFSWTFGDGTTGTGNPATHTYTASGSYSAGLSVSDSKGATGAASTTVTVTGTPPASVIVASDAAPGPSSLATAGGQKLIQDSAGKMIAVYTDSLGRIGLSYANSDPMIGGWSAPVKSSTPASAYARPAAVLASLTSLRLVVEGGSGTGIISDIPVVIQRDSQNNITGFTIGTPKTLDSSGLGRYPTAILLHNGDILAAWAWQNSTRTMVKSLRWDSSTGWTNLAGSSSTPDIALLDPVSITWFVPDMIERPDNNNVYLMANRFTGPPETIALNKATWNGSGWSWGSQNITYETNCSDADDDPVGLAWDPVRSLVVVAYGITGTLSYGVFTLTSQDVKTHLDTPSLAVTNRGWAGIAVHITTGDYYLFLMNVNTDGGSGPLGYVRLPAGGVWNPAVNYLDSSASDQVLSLRPTGTGPTIDLVYATGISSPFTIKFTSVRPSNPSSFSVSANPTILTTQAGSSAISTVTLTSLNGFAGTVSLSTNVSPSGLTASVSPSSIALTGGGTGTSMLTANSAIAGTYTVTIVATSGSASQSVQVTVRVTDFTVSVQSSLTVTSGSATTSNVTLNSLNGFAGTVNLATSASPSGVTVSLSPTSITLTSGGTGASNLNVTSSTVGTYTVTITGTSASLSHTAFVNVNVVASSGFSVAADPSAVGFQSGSNASATITLTSLGNFSGDVDLAESVNPSTGLTVSCNPTSVFLSPESSANSTCTFASSAPNSYTVTITASNGPLSHTATITVEVGGFTISASPTTVNIQAGGSGTSSITVLSVAGFMGMINFSTYASPTGLTASISPASIGLSPGGLGSSTLTISSSTIGAYAVTVTGTSGSSTHSVTITVNVQDFTLAVNPSSLSLAAGTTGTITVSIASMAGFAGTVSLFAVCTPGGPKLSLSSSSVPLSSGGFGTSTLTVRTLHKTPPGTYTITITATSGSLIHTATVVLTVT